VKGVKGAQTDTDAELEAIDNYGMRIGAENKKKIYDNILEHIDGLLPHEIASSLKLTRQTVQTHLKELVNETLVHKNRSNGRYYAGDLDLGHIAAFANIMKEASGLLVKCIDPTTISHMSSTNDEKVCKKVSSNSISASLCEPKFSEDDLKKYVFEFANRIGAFITYILIETMRPYDYNELAKDPNWKIRKRNILADRLTKRAIDIRFLFEKFHLLLYNTEQVSHRAHYGSDEPWFFEANKIEFDKIMRTFSKVYPGIYDALEDYWQDKKWPSLNALEVVERYAPQVLEGCKHNWRKIKIYKIEGDYYRCKNKCRMTVNARDKKLLDEKTKRSLY
jgi:DNA-binding transcriptional ArsR family regulator